MEITRISFGVDGKDLVRVTVVDPRGGRTDHTFSGVAVRAWNEAFHGVVPFQKNTTPGTPLLMGMRVITYQGARLAVIRSGEEAATEDFSAEDANDIVEDLFASVQVLGMQGWASFANCDPEKDFVIRDAGRRQLRRGPQSQVRTHRRQGDEQQLVVNLRTEAPPGS